MGLRAKSTGNPDIISGFQILIFYTFAWSFMMISFIIESLILLFFGIAVLFIGVIYGFISYRKLTTVGFYSLVPTIFEAANRQTNNTKGKFIDNPYKTKIKELNNNELKTYAKFLLKNGIALRCSERQNSITIYFRRPIKLEQIILLPPLLVFDQSWIEIKNDGNITIFASKKAYEFFDFPGTYKGFCKAIANIIDESVNLYLMGDEQEALKKLGVGIKKL